MATALTTWARMRSSDATAERQSSGNGSMGNRPLDIRNNTLKGSLGEAIRVRSSATGALTGP